MNDLSHKLLLPKTAPSYLFELSQMIDRTYDSKIVKHIFGEKNNISFYYFENNQTLSKNVSNIHAHWVRVNSFLLSIFKEGADATGVHAVMRHKDTKCVEIIHKNDLLAKEKPSDVSCFKH